MKEQTKLKYIKKAVILNHPMITGKKLNDKRTKGGRYLKQKKVT